MAAFSCTAGHVRAHWRPLRPRQNPRLHAATAPTVNDEQPLVNTPVVGAPSQEDLDTLAPGTRVVVHNLLGKPELNGAVGNIMGRDANSGRYAVELLD